MKRWRGARLLGVGVFFFNQRRSEKNKKGFGGLGSGSHSGSDFFATPLYYLLRLAFFERARARWKGKARGEENTDTKGRGRESVCVSVEGGCGGGDVGFGATARSKRPSSREEC